MRKLKRFTIHILGIRALGEDTFDLPEDRNAIIVCTRPDTKAIFACRPENILILDFPDAEDPHFPGAFNSAHARKVISFVAGLKTEVTDIYICCNKGGSRSPAVAASLLAMSGRSDKDVWLNPYYVPNTLVYYRLCKESGIRLARIRTLVRKIQNQLAFSKAKKHGGSECERWQILF